MENNNSDKLTNLIEANIKLRPSQKAILKVIEHSIAKGEVDSAIDLVKKVSCNLKDDDKNKFHDILFTVKPLRSALEKAGIITKVNYIIKENELSDESKIETIAKKTEDAFVEKKETAFLDESKLINQQEEIDVKIDEEVKEHEKIKGDTIQIEGEVIQIGSEGEAKVQIDSAKIVENLEKEDEYNSLGVDLIPESEKEKQTKLEESLKDEYSEIADKNKLQDRAKDLNEPYNSLDIDLIPQGEKDDVLSFLDKLKKEINSFPGSPFSQKGLVSKGDFSPQTFNPIDNNRGNLADSIVSDEEIEQIINSATNSQDSVFHIEEPPMSSQRNKIPSQNVPFTVGEKSLKDSSFQELLKQDSLSSAQNIIQSASGGYDFIPNVSTPGKIQFEYATQSNESQLPQNNKISDSISPLKSQKEDFLDSSIKDLLKSALTDAIDNMVEGFKDENKDLFEKVEKTKPKIEKPVIKMPEIEQEEEDDSKDWVREPKDTNFKVQSFDEGEDESVGRYDNYDDEDEDDIKPFKDVNKELFDEVEKTSKNTNRLEDFDNEKDLSVEHKKTAEGAREIVVTNLNPEKKKRKPPKKLPKKVRLSFSFRNLFNNKAYIKYKEILNRAAILVAEKKLDEALDYYYTIRDQNIPNVFKMMIQQNIDDIEETIMNTFQYSDTIVKLKDSGKAIRLRDINEHERQIQEQQKQLRAKKRSEVYFDNENEEYEYLDDLDSFED